MRYMLGLFAVALVFTSVSARAGDLAEKLPKDTLIYFQVDVRRLLDEGHRYNKLVSADAAEGLAAELVELHKAVKELAAGYEFTPALLDKILDAKVYVVWMAKAEPEIMTHTYKMPKRDLKTRQPTGEFEERSYTSTNTTTLSLVIETTDEAAGEFMVQLKALRERLQNKETDPKKKESLGWKEVKVDHGEMISEVKASSTIGRSGQYLVLSDCQPKELWAALAAKPAATLADTDLYQRYTKAKTRSVALFLLNIEAMIARHEADLKKDIDEAKKEAEKAGNPAGKEAAQTNWRSERAERELQQYQFFKKLFSLDQIGQLGINLATDATEKSFAVETSVAVRLGDKLSPAVRNILDGGRKLQVPEVGEQNGLALFLRAGAKEILKDVVASMDEKMAAGFNEGMAEMKTSIGYNLPELVEHLAGDGYLFLNLVEKEREKRSWNREQKKWETTTVKEPMPELLVLLGLNDREAFVKAMTTIVSTASADPGMARMIKKRTYQGTDVFVVGFLKNDDALPDGLSSYAVVAVDRYLSFGTWDEVTGLIRRTKAAEKGANQKLTAALALYPESNLLLCAAKPFFEKMNKASSRKDFIDEINREIDQATLPLADEKLTVKIKTSLKNSWKHIIALSEKSQALAQDLMVVHGQFQGGLYELKASSELKK
jgi:hypothetical protein